MISVAAAARTDGARAFEFVDERFGVCGGGEVERARMSSSDGERPVSANVSRTKLRVAAVWAFMRAPARLPVDSASAESDHISDGTSRGGRAIAAT